MAVAHRATSGVTTVLSSTLSIPAPSGAVANDIIVVYVSIYQSTTAPSISGGTGSWSSAIYVGLHDPGDPVRGYIFWKRATGAESGNYTVSGYGGDYWIEGIAVAVSGVDSGVTNPVEDWDYAAIDSTGTVFGAVSVTTADADPFLLWFGDTYSGDSDTPPTGFTETYDAGNLTSSAYRIPGAAGTYSTSGGTGSHLTSGGSGATLIALASGGSGGPEEPPEPSVTYVSSSARVVSTGTSVGATYPDSIAKDDLLIMVVGQKASTWNAGTCATPGGWIPLGAWAGGGYGTVGVDTGDTQMYAFARVADGTETGTVAVTLGTNNVSWVTISRFTKVGDNWSIVADGGTDNVGEDAANNINIVTSGNIGLEPGDIVYGAFCCGTDGVTYSAETFTSSGVTFDTAAEIADIGTNSGNDIGGFHCYASVTAGSSTAATTMTATTTIGTYRTRARGPGTVIRIRATNNPTTGMAFVADNTAVALGAVDPLVVSVTPSHVGNALVAVVAIRADASRTVGSITDDGGNTWTRLVSENPGTGSSTRIEMWGTITTAVVTTVNIYQVGGAALKIAANVSEWSGVGSFDSVTGHTSGAATTVALSGAATPSVDSVIAIGGLNTTTAGGGHAPYLDWKALKDFVTTGGSDVYGSVAWKVIPTPVSVQASWLHESTVNYSGVLAFLLPPSGEVSYTFFEWNGTTEVAVTLDGEWNGTTIVPITLDEVLT